ncbi:MAG: hypothetical protein WCP09_01505 [Candidatus Taylorbacteria bacterium]
MKKSKIAVSVVMLLSLLGISASAQQISSVRPPNGGGFQDSEMLARAFLRHTTDHYRGNVNTEQKLDNGYTQPICMQFGMGKDMMITNLVINGKNIPLVRPLAGIPVPVSGYHFFDLRLEAYDENESLASTGDYHAKGLRVGDRISVVLQPKMPLIEIPLHDWVSITNIDVMMDGADWLGWCVENGMLIIQPGPFSINARYEVIDRSTGETVARSYIDPFAGKEGDQEAVFSVTQAGGVTPVDLKNITYTGFGGQQFDGHIYREGKALSAKVYSLSGVNRESFTIWVTNLGDGSVTIKKPVEFGEMPEIPTKKVVDEEGMVTYSASEPIDKAVVIVQPASGDTNNTKFGISFQTTRLAFSAP